MDSNILIFCSRKTDMMKNEFRFRKYSRLPLNGCLPNLIILTEYETLNFKNRDNQFQ